MIVKPSDDLAAAIARLGGEEDGQVWSDSWNDLCHQGCVHDDSFLVLPHVAAVADGHAPGAPQEAVLAAGLIGDCATAEPVKATLPPAGPAALAPLPARLHQTATQAGHEGVARGVTHLFGHATRPACDDVFAVSEQVEASHR
ncbi:hypothetical protein [Streptomyces sp. NPDC005251]|uniref:hypothetical protein n=1 Tax=unclassified Streptomyces TaxID=2593676 RepID=UPI0033A627B4